MRMTEDLQLACPWCFASRVKMTGHEEISYPNYIAVRFRCLDCGHVSYVEILTQGERSDIGWRKVRHVAVTELEICDQKTERDFQS